MDALGNHSETHSNINIKPYLSIVATARNDNHGGNLLPRMQMFIEGIIEQCNKFQLPAELIIVEWNPPVENDRLCDAIHWPDNYNSSSSFCDVRIIEVPAEIHNRYKHAQQLPLFQMIGKNVAIRRARGVFVLATNIDILFSNELIQYIARQQLQLNRLYRIDRSDVDADIPVNASVEQRLQYCKNHIIRLERYDGTINLLSGDFHRIYWEKDLRVRLLEFLQHKHLIPVVTRERLHLNACGDFTMMAKDRWERVRGYPEFEMYSMHLDSVLCTQAHFDGTREYILEKPMCIYHIEHSTGSGFTPEGEAKLNSRLSAAGIPQLSHEQFHKWAIQMRKNNQTLIFNENANGWGLGQDDLLEIRPYEYSSVVSC